MSEARHTFFFPFYRFAYFANAKQVHFDRLLCTDKTGTDADDETRYLAAYSDDRTDFSKVLTRRVPADIIDKAEAFLPIAYAFWFIMMKNSAVRLRPSKRLEVEWTSALDEKGVYYLSYSHKIDLLMVLAQLGLAFLARAADNIEGSARAALEDCKNAESVFEYAENALAQWDAPPMERPPETSLPVIKALRGYAKGLQEAAMLHMNFQRPSSLRLSKWAFDIANKCQVLHVALRSNKVFQKTGYAPFANFVEMQELIARCNGYLYLSNHYLTAPTAEECHGGRAVACTKEATLLFDSMPINYGHMGQVARDLAQWRIDVFTSDERAHKINNEVLYHSDAEVPLKMLDAAEMETRLTWHPEEPDRYFMETFGIKVTQ